MPSWMKTQATCPQFVVDTNVVYFNVQGRTSVHMPILITTIIMIMNNIIIVVMVVIVVDILIVAEDAIMHYHCDDNETME